MVDLKCVHPMKMLGIWKKRGIFLKSFPTFNVDVKILCNSTEKNDLGKNVKKNWLS